MAVQYLLPCPECEQTTPVDLKQAGQQFSCAHCGHSFEVPKMGRLKQLDVLEDPVSSGKSTGHNPLQAWLFAAGLVIAVIAAAAGGGLYYYASQLIADVDIDQAIDQQVAAFDELTPSQLFDAWKALNEEDLGDWQENVTIRYNKQGQILQKVAYGIFGLSGVGVLMLLSSFFVGPGRPT